MQRDSISLRTQLVVAAPPTPNGDLHIGHLAGPYLGADVATRYMRLRGECVASSFSVDTNQSHVVVTAEKERRDPNEFAVENTDKIEGTLSLGGISFDVHGRPDAEYGAFIQNYFRAIFEKGLFKTCEREFWYDVKRGRYLF